MNENTHLYTPPNVTQDSEYIPSEVRDYLNGEDLLSKKQAIRLSTVNTCLLYTSPSPRD